MAMPMRHVSAPLCLSATAILFAATSSAQSPPPAGAQASGQGAVAADRSAASAQGSTPGAAQTDDKSATLASGASVNAVLTKPVDSRHTKPGDPVTVRTTQNARTEGGTSSPKGSLMGHVSDTRGRRRSGRLIGGYRLREVGDPGRPRDSTSQRRDPGGGRGGGEGGEQCRTGAITGAGGGAGMSHGGGLLGRTTGVVGGTVGSGLGGPAAWGRCERRRRYFAGGSRPAAAANSKDGSKLKLLPASRKPVVCLMTQK
jgi:hypothetical protein